MYPDFYPDDKKSLPADSPAVEFQFFNYSHPSDANTYAYRKKARSYITKRQHQRKRDFATKKIAQSHRVGATVCESSPQRVHVVTMVSNHQTLSKLAIMQEDSRHDGVEKFEPAMHMSDNHSLSYTDSVKLDPRDWPVYISRIMASFTRKRNMRTWLTYAGGLSVQC
jgi:hypothetical protein